MNTRTTLACAALMFLGAVLCGAQTSELWLDYYATNIRGDWTFEVNPGVSKGWGDAPWLDTYVATSVAYQALNWLSSEGNLEAHYTFDKTQEDVLEVRPWVGLNFIWPTFGTHLNLFYPALSFRLEERFLWYQESGTSAQKTRLRVRVFARFTLNNETMIPGTYYLLALAEDYVPLDGEVREVSADRRRFQAGLGYVVASDLRVELQYVLMRTRDSYSNTFENGSHIVWLAVRNYF